MSDAKPTADTSASTDLEAQLSSVPSLTLVSELSGHSDRAWSAAWNPREALLATCSTDKDVRLFSYTNNPTPTFNLRETIPTGHKRTVRQVSWSPSGRTLATASFDSTVGIWQPLESYDDPSTVDVSGEPSSSHSTTIWDCIGTLEGHESECKSVSFNRNGTLLASCSRDKSVWIWEVQPDGDFECLSVLMEHSQDVKCVTWHPTEDILASASYDDTIKLYIDDPSDDWFCFATLTGHESTVWSVKFSPCGRYLVSAADDETLRVWVRLNEEQASERGLRVDGKMPGRKGEKWVCSNVIKGWWSRTVYCVDWTAASEGKDGESLGRIAAGGGDGRICVFDVDNSLKPTITLIANIDDAHGVSDLNSLAFGPVDLSGQSSGLSMADFPDAPPQDGDGGRFEEIEEDDGAAPQTTGKNKHNRLNHLLASTGDDGSLKVWRLPTEDELKRTRESS